MRTLRIIIYLFGFLTSCDIASAQLATNAVCTVEDKCSSLLITDIVSGRQLVEPKTAVHFTRLNPQTLQLQANIGGSPICTWVDSTIHVIAPTIDSAMVIMQIIQSYTCTQCAGATQGPTGATGPTGLMGATGPMGTLAYDTIWGITSGVTVPDTAFTININRLTAFASSWQQIDSLVTVYGGFNAHVTSTIQQGQINFTLPVPTTLFPYLKLHGVLTCTNGNISGGSLEGAGNTVQMQYFAPDTGAHLFEFTYQYVTDHPQPGQVIQGIQGATGPTGAGGIANNGLTINNDTTQLGGTLNQVTIINTAGNPFGIGDLNNNDDIIYVDPGVGAIVKAKYQPVSVTTQQQFTVKDTGGTVAFDANVSQWFVQTPYIFNEGKVTLDGTQPMVGLSVIDRQSGYYLFHVDTQGRGFINNENYGYNSWEIFPEGKIRQGNGVATLDRSMDSLTQPRKTQAADSSNPSGTTYEVLSVGGQYAKKNGDIPLTGIPKSGRYYPVITNQANIVSFVIDSLQYVRTDNVVVMSGSCMVTSSATGGSTFQISLPIASNISDGTYIAGTGASASTNTGIRIHGNIANNTAQFDWRSPAPSVTDTFSFVITEWVNN